MQVKACNVHPGTWTCLRLLIFAASMLVLLFCQLQCCRSFCCAPAARANGALTQCCMCMGSVAAHRMRSHLPNNLPSLVHIFLGVNYAHVVQASIAHSTSLFINQVNNLLFSTYFFFVHLFLFIHPWCFQPWCLVCLQVAVLYSADYGFSDRLSQTLAKGITKANVKTEMVDVLSVDPQVIIIGILVSMVCGENMIKQMNCADMCADCVECCGTGNCAPTCCCCCCWNKHGVCPARDCRG